MDDHKANRFKMDCDEFERLMRSVNARLSAARLCVRKSQTEAEAHDLLKKAEYQVGKMFQRMHMVIEYAARYKPDANES